MPEPSPSPTAATLFEDSAAAVYIESADSISRAEGEVTGRVRKPLQFGFYLAIGYVLLVTFLAIFAGVLPFVGEPDQINSEFKSAPSADFWMGTDNIGRDIFARVVYGARMSLTIAGASIVVGLLIGGFLGLLAGYYGKRTDRAISTGADIMLAFPALILTLALVSVLGERYPDARAWLVIASLAVLSIAPLTRIVRASTLVYAQREFVTAARSLGAKNRRVLWREVLPNVVPSMVSFALTGLAVLIIAEGALAFLGQSVKVPTPTWGLMINEGRENLDDAPWISLMPAAVMFLTILSFNIIGDVLSKKFDIKESLL